MVDRTSSLTPDTVLGKDDDYSSCRFFPVQDHFKRFDLESLTRELFPDGLTLHGKKYFLDECIVIRTDQGPAPSVPNVPVVELIVELVRRLEFPEKFSRFESVFAWQTIDEARMFRSEYGQGSILLVEGEMVGRYDMKQLYLGGTTVGSWKFARRYWAGNVSPDPRWEILLKPPVKIIKVCEQ